ncbi:hypothetical protein RAC89_28270 [Paenibacillus sp. GD4]|jgi:hypothetical protein|uniref:hypothetical protein n=1 Tax=Paenibacillus sp. GD4 TaxID=3068890 RepID=UPI0027965110|nr:hypothetical protein [Paenibacillus sp. GD4]MDQ1914279.1 hypothetical protein [Paenibacillus sp. GD4]
MSSKIIDRETKSMVRKWIKKMKKKNYPKGKKTGKRAEKKLKLPYKTLGIGNYRIVYDMDNGYVLKVATTKQGIKSNQIEKKIYKKSPRSLQKHLAKVKKSGFGWVIMKKAEEISEKKRYIKKITRLKKKFGKAGIIARDILRNKPIWHNIGKLKRKIVLIDYGKFKITKD